MKDKSQQLGMVSPEFWRYSFVHKEKMNMPKAIEAIYENGVFKPLEKIDIKEHTKLTIVLPASSEQPILKDSSLEAVIDIAKDCSDSDLSTHHDKYLYGEVPG